MASDISWRSKPVLISLVTVLSVYATALMVSSWIFRTTREVGLTLADDPPLYSIREDFIRGACLAAGLLFYVGFVRVLFRRHMEAIFRVTIGALVFFADPIVWAFIIYASSSQLFDSRNAKVPWATFEDYLRVREYAFLGTIALFLAVVFIGFARARRKNNMKV